MAAHDFWVRRVFLRALGGVHLLAFVSLWVQIHGLVGEHGLLPVARLLQAASARFGRSAWLHLPTLCWLDPSDRMLTALCTAGTVLALALIAGLAPRLALAGLWMVYLSLCGAGQAFLGFQWDTLLLETTFCSILYAPRGLWPGRNGPSVPPLAVARWVLWCLAFKLMFLSGATKLLSGDRTWIDGTALQYHYFTQPIPSWTSWYAQQWPAGVQRASLLAMFVVELVLPFFVIAGRRGRAAFALGTLLLMAAIEATGNFGFFNLLTAVLCLPLLDDRLLLRAVPLRWRPQPPTGPPRPRPRWRVVAGTLLGGLMLAVSLLTAVRELDRTRERHNSPAAVAGALDLGQWALLSWGEPWVLEPLAPLRTINGYGLFRVMTTRRPEIVMEYSHDGKQWREYDFRYKPGRLDRAPPLVAPYMPRLDWQMWFAALHPSGNSYWLGSLAEQILAGNPATARLIGEPEIATNPPQYVQFVLYDYAFATPNDRRRTGAWWVRTRQGELTGPLSRRQ